MNEQEAQTKLAKVPKFLEEERFEEAERLLIAVLREANEKSPTHWAGLITLGELYESQQRYPEGLIVCREIPQGMDPQEPLGQRGLELMSRLHAAEGEAELSESCLRKLEASPTTVRYQVSNTSLFRPH